jgi:hypothetical protein
MCRWGFSNIKKTLESVTDDRMSAYVVWLPIFGGDFRGEARKLSKSFPDKRVTYFIDAGSRTGELWEHVLKTERDIAWDVYQANGNNDRLKVEFLYFKECPGHKQALANLKDALRESKLRANLVLLNVSSAEEAEKTGFQGSPSIRVNGKDLDGRNDAFSFACRIYNIDGKITPTPTKEFIKAKLRAIQP